MEKKEGMGEKGGEGKGGEGGGIEIGERRGIREETCESKGESMRGETEREREREYNRRVRKKGDDNHLYLNAEYISK